MSQSFKVFGKSDVGLVRTGNEDNLLIDKKNSLFIVCDGMGGHQAGEVASMMACEMIQTCFNKFYKEISEDKALSLMETLPVKGDLLVKSIRLANRAIYNSAVDNTALHGMGTTIVAFTLENDILSIAHVGDSRAYRIDDKKLEPLTIDHSWVAEIQQTQNISEEEASSVVGKNVITRALGVHNYVEVDFKSIRVKPKEKYILCSDGLCGYADDDEIFNTVSPIKDNNESIVNNLIQMANDRGGADNVTVIVLEIVDADKTQLSLVDKITVPKETDEQLKEADNWLKKINDYIANRDKKKTEDENPPNKKLIILIFVLFVVIAAIVIYYAGGSQ